MCGRFSRDYTWAQIYAMYSLTSPPSNVQPNYNVCPTTKIDVVISGEGKRVLVPMRWGLIRAGGKTPPRESSRITSRGATVR